MRVTTTAPGDEGTVKVTFENGSGMDSSIVDRAGEIKIIEKITRSVGGDFTYYRQVSGCP